MFSNRLRSSSKMDFFDSTDLTMSEGGSSCTSRSRNFVRNELPVAELDEDSGDGDNDAVDWWC